MGLFDFLKRKEAPDFSDAPDPFAGQEAFGQDPLGQQEGFGRQQDPLGQDPFGSREPLGGQQAGYPQQGGQRGSEEAYRPGGQAFNHEIFQPSPGNERARAYAQSLHQQGAEQGPAQEQVRGHEAALILERLDTIKAELDALRQRFLRVERYLEEKPGRRLY